MRLVPQPLRPNVFFLNNHPNPFGVTPSCGYNFGARKIAFARVRVEIMYLVESTPWVMRFERDLLIETRGRLLEKFNVFC